MVPSVFVISSPFLSSSSSSSSSLLSSPSRFSLLGLLDPVIALIPSSFQVAHDALKFQAPEKLLFVLGTGNVTGASVDVSNNTNNANNSNKSVVGALLRAAQERMPDVHKGKKAMAIPEPPLTYRINTLAQSLPKNSKMSRDLSVLLDKKSKWGERLVSTIFLMSEQSAYDCTFYSLLFFSYLNFYF